MEPEPTPPTETLPPEPTASAERVTAPVNEAPAVSMSTPKRPIRWLDTVLVLAVIAGAGVAGWWLANRDKSTPSSSDTITATPTASPTPTPTPDFTAMDAALKDIDTSLDSTDTSTTNAANAPADSDTAP